MPSGNWAWSKTTKECLMRSSLGGTTILLIILALLVMASGIGLIYYSAVFHPGQLYAQATATAQASGTANAQATRPAQAYANSTATAQAVATAQAMATTTALQNIYNQATSGAPILNDPLNANNIYHWDAGNASLGGSCGFKAE